MDLSARTLQTIWPNGFQRCFHALARRLELPGWFETCAWRRRILTQWGGKIFKRTLDANLAVD